MVGVVGAVSASCFSASSHRAVSADPAGVPPLARISLLHLAGVPWARIGEHVGQRNLAVTANTYTHAMVAEDELDYGKFARACPNVTASCPPG
jgi:hypothetical protein